MAHGPPDRRPPRRQRRSRCRRKAALVPAHQEDENTERAGDGTVGRPLTGMPAFEAGLSRVAAEDDPKALAGASKEVYARNANVPSRPDFIVARGRPE